MKSIRWITPRWRANWKLSGVLSARIIIGVDYHPSFQQIAWVDNGSGERGEQRLQHNEEAETFYRDLKERGVSVRIGMRGGGTYALVRTLTNRIAVRVMDRRCSAD